MTHDLTGSMVREAQCHLNESRERRDKFLPALQKKKKRVQELIKKMISYAL